MSLTNMPKMAFSSVLPAKTITIPESEQRIMDSSPTICSHPIQFHFFQPHWCSRCVVFTEGVACVPMYAHIWLHWVFSELQSRCQFPFTLPCLITSWLWFLGRSVWLQSHWPDTLQCQAFPRTAPSLDLETPSAIPSLETPSAQFQEKCADIEIPAEHRHAIFGDISEQSRMFFKAPGAVITLSCHSVVIYALKSNWILFIFTIIGLNLWALILGFFLIHGEVEELQVFSGSRVTAVIFGSLSCYLLSNTSAIPGSNWKHLSVPLT